MIDKKYLELIHKDIDKVITPREKEALDSYLRANPEADELYRDLAESENLLDSLPQIEASENLKKRILNSIDYNRYAPKAKKNYIKSFLTARKPGFTLSFSLGLIAGIFLIALFISNPGLINTFDQKDVSGTMGLYNAQQVGSFNIDVNGVIGSVEIIKGSHKSSSSAYHYGFAVDLSSSGTYDFEVRFDPSSTTLEHMTSPDSDNIQLDEQDGSIHISSAGDNTYSLLFSSKETSGTFTLKISRNGTDLYERQVFVKY
jgi:hypothetical protein